ncbi:MAG: 50S ribosomal protein L24 [Candidatus Paceibacterota bacterium]
MKIKKDDKVIVIAGKDRGKTGKVLRAFPREDTVIVEGVNTAKRHQRATNQTKVGQIVEKTLPIHVSNVMVVDPKKGGRTRVGIKKVDGKYTRIAKKSGTTLS